MIYKSPYLNVFIIDRFILSASHIVDNNMPSKSIGEYTQPAGDSISLTTIGESPFTIVGVEDSNYKDGDTETPGVKIITKEFFDDPASGESFNKLHTTRKAVVSKLTNKELRADIDNGTSIGPVKCVKVKSKTGGKPYYDLVDASS